MTDENAKRAPWTWEEVPLVGIEADGKPGVVGSTRLRRHHCAFGDYPWDHWCARAKAAGVGDELAELGRAVMREADQHTWPEVLQEECGWDDDGATMIDLAHRYPVAARARWQWLLDTDGGRSLGDEDTLETDELA